MTKEGQSDAWHTPSDHMHIIIKHFVGIRPSSILDIGTNLGHSALALSYNNTNKVISYDIVECNRPPGSKQPPNIEYRTGDVLEDERLFDSPLIMLDTNHDGVFEKRFCSSLVEFS